MKKHLTLFFACLIFAGSLFAQQHLSFKGVPIDGTLKAYTDAMIKAGFHYEGTQDGIAVLSGDFAGHKDCTIGVYTLKNLDVVSFITVLFPDQKTWTSLKSEYEILKSMLTEKYGEPEESKERFTTYVGDYSNGLVMHALKDEKYEWHTNFSTEWGTIKLTISEGEEYSTGRVVLVYMDKANGEKVRNAAMDDL